jgi:hypothetical protein
VPSILPRNAVVLARTEDLDDCASMLVNKSTYSLRAQPTLDIPPSRMEAIERGLVRTHSGLVLLPVPSLSLGLGDGVPCGDADEPTVTLEVTDL